MNDYGGLAYKNAGDVRLLRLLSSSPVESWTAAVVRGTMQMAAGQMPAVRWWKQANPRGDERAFSDLPGLNAGWRMRTITIGSLLSRPYISYKLFYPYILRDF